ncbi:hypothetical protein [Clostridium sp. LIBA-8841]|nr:hypothetical protein [Clostridium sp. LIBA-8841]MDZ5253688.1 hypothetical protein [Clostridium sp. LIBA-8841]
MYRKIVNYPIEIKLKALEMYLEGLENTKITKLNNRTPIEFKCAAY